MMNVWIMKPGNKSRGRGIVLLNKLEDVMAKMNPSSKSDTRYVVQKYIGNRGPAKFSNKRNKNINEEF